jgi:hypothetical protein
MQLNDVTLPGNPQPDGNHDHAYVYGPKPPVAPVVEIVIVWPSSTGFTVAETAPAPSVGSTVSVNVPVTALPFPSVTVSITVYGKLDESPTAGVQLNDVTLPGDPQPDGSSDHAYVYGPKPPVAPVVETIVTWPSSTGFTVADTVPANKAGSTTRFSVVPTMFPFPSVTISNAVYGEPDESPTAGVQLNNTTLPGDQQPDGNPDHAYVYGPKPPVAPVVEIVVVWPSSTGFTVAETVPALSSELTTNVTVPVAVFPFPSVTVTITGYVPPIDGVQLNPETLPGSEHHGGSPDHAYV